MKLAPICFFTYNRLNETKKTIECLKRNKLASESNLYIFSDSWKNADSKPAVKLVREYNRTVKGFNSVSIIERSMNFGLAKSIISGVSEVIEKYGKVIVLEDDLITSENFLVYMNESLNFYVENKKIWSISGFSFPIKYPSDYKYDVAFGLRSSSWGWATWGDRWCNVDWQISSYDKFFADKVAQKEFRLGGSDLPKMLKDQVSGKIDSWAIRFCYAQFLNQAFDVFPVNSKVQNIGFSETATNTHSMGRRFSTELDSTGKLEFRLPEEVTIEPIILNQFRKPFSIFTRLKFKLLKKLT